MGKPHDGQAVCAANAPAVLAAAEAAAARRGGAAVVAYATTPYFTDLTAQARRVPPHGASGRCVAERTLWPPR
jgi:hypothetical protein